MKLKQEIPLILIVILPLLYVSYVWNLIPETVPIHWNVKGEIDKYGNKITHLLIISLLPVFVYTLFLIMVKIDPKKKLDKMGNKFQKLKFLLVVIFSTLSICLIYFTKNQSPLNPNYIFFLIGVLFIILGNYSKTLKPNYFLGIRTPWTLESESVWKKTHKIGGILMFIGGFSVAFSSLILNAQFNWKFLLIVIGIISILPILYSFYIFKKESPISN